MGGWGRASVLKFRFSYSIHLGRRPSFTVAWGNAGNAPGTRGNTSFWPKAISNEAKFEYGLRPKNFRVASHTWGDAGDAPGYGETRASPIETTEIATSKALASPRKTCSEQKRLLLLQTTDVILGLIESPCRTRRPLGPVLCIARFLRSGGIA